MITAKNICSSKFHKDIKANVVANYKDLIQDIREDMAQGFETEHLSKEFLQGLAKIIKDPALNNYTSFNFYWTTLLENLIYVVQLHDEIQEAEEDESDFEFSESEDELFNFWNDSEMAQSFLEMLDESNNIIEASSNLLTILENQILSFYYLHIASTHHELKDVILYNVIPEIGDSPERMYIGEQHRIADFPEPSDIYPSIALKSVFEQRQGFEVEINTDLYEVPIRENHDYITVGEHRIFLLPICEEGRKREIEFKEKIGLALKLIGDSNPGLLDTFMSFTHSIVPVNEPGIVSFSMQSLPGFSSINMFERDFVDLMDDLLHENGHHYLNTFLNYTELIFEDDEKIYYSPWRRALRPIRGIYHAVFTFYWALNLFHELDAAITTGKLDAFYKFTKEEKLKVKRRAVEEYYMLTYCALDLEHAFENGKVSPEGNNLILSIYNLIEQMKDGITAIHKTLLEQDPESGKEINELVETLKEKRAHYSLND
ncbi:HEXXH motif domain protein [Bacteriovorax sp. BSW11_IV]|uniref:aKG-HExxH-type peptide beta-hydroxylase n=1 Tax=Bacteriovorax sp. BSW11_IV TaxID=1353529 RepID=UPI00038A3C51|nr:HEXXH motif-containing putative peptide modification protein [Bacteriovorax sp. BSW11_IV]EQC45139.1 HEXXH motif domain protein [Bacteriovorax sp. BSW11_IV]